MSAWIKLFFCYFSNFVQPFTRSCIHSIFPFSPSNSFLLFFCLCSSFLSFLPYITFLTVISSVYIIESNQGLFFLFRNFILCFRFHSFMESFHLLFYFQSLIFSLCSFLPSFMSFSFSSWTLLELGHFSVFEVSSSSEHHYPSLSVCYLLLLHHSLPPLPSRALLNLFILGLPGISKIQSFISHLIRLTFLATSFS